MALMIPDAPPEFGPGMKAETALYEAFESQLPDDFFVYHGLRYLEAERAAEGEADFLILHREHGLLSVECKGEGVRRTGTGQWFRIYGDGREQSLKEDPFQQAQRTVKGLVKELTNRLQGMIPRLEGRFPFFHGHAVAFPSAFVDELNLPLDVQRRIVLDASEMSGIQQKILDVYDFWKADRPDRTPLEEWEFKAFRKKVLHPKLHLVESLGAWLDLNTQRMIRLTEEQVVTLKGAISNPRLKVSGGAGTGKTVLALEAAKMLADKEMHVLLMCYNRGLSRYLEKAVEDWEGKNGTVEVHTFHRLCRKAYESLDMRFVVPTGNDAEVSARFWNEGAPLMLMEALDRGKLGPWDGIVIDEGQDFAGDWWAVIEECLKDKETGNLIVFYDPQQEIFGRGCNIPEFGVPFSLNCNFRNTRMIFEAIRRVVDVHMELHSRCPEGIEVRRHLQKSRRKAQETIEGLLRKYIEEEHIRPEQITIITPHTRDNSLLAGMERMAGFPLAEDPSDRRGAVLHTTIGKFKGLESDVLIFADIDPEDELCNVNARYVAMSRGRQILHEFWKREW